MCTLVALPLHTCKRFSHELDAPVLVLHHVDAGGLNQVGQPLVDGYQQQRHRQTSHERELNLNK